MRNLKDKKLLVLGGTNATLDVVRFAKELGVYVIVTDDAKTGISKEQADQKEYISTADIVGLCKLIREKEIDGILTGASEFNIQNCIAVAEQSGIPFYVTKAQWDLLANKCSFKDLCRKYNVPTVKEFDFEHPESFEYPVIVKPVDGCSARGITVCNDKTEYQVAIIKAYEHSVSKRIIVEKYVENGGTTVSTRYILRDGELYLQAVGDRFVLNAEKGKALITWAAIYPSKYTDYYIAHTDATVKNMFREAGLKNGCLFMEAIPTDDGIYFYEMGYRISGGMTYKITEITNGANELKMLISYSLTGSMCDEGDLKTIDPFLNGMFAATLAIPLETGKIGSISGMEQINTIPEVYFSTQYYHVGDEITPQKVGTLDQLFARFTLIADSKEVLAKVIDNINEKLSVKDTFGIELYLKRFNLSQF